MSERYEHVLDRIPDNSEYTEWKTDNEELGDPNILIDELSACIEALQAKLDALEAKLPKDAEGNVVCPSDALYHPSLAGPLWPCPDDPEKARSYIGLGEFETRPIDSCYLSREAANQAAKEKTDD